ncbi:hypothetical protein IVA87_07525 [Bradyrhizobium sp. 147]|uniref:hypothetical protein n=1 Tax=Bradyrhizobium sp. 147 TaxID=2782623 RepID=UPI001FF82B02|nr:hypothetical protein [Bradyrhizobium sp. 147]MCK1679321.1 hypothetical protein [Bradyrhizobium sp. 147]
MKKVSLADLIVLGGSAPVEKTAKDAGIDLKVGCTQTTVLPLKILLRSKLSISSLKRRLERPRMT